MADIYRLFAARLKERRIRLNMTQRELGELLGYSEKTVSKWESGAAIAPSAVLPQLAAALKTDINSLLLERENHYFLGIDGGGTKTELALSDEGGNIIRTVTLEGCNPVDVGFAKTREILTRGIGEVVGDISTASVFCFAGIAGGITGTNREKIRGLLSEFGFVDFNNGSDAENAVASALGDSDGTVVIIGTGTIAFTKKGRALTRHGGWGYLFEEGGSGFSVGRAAVMHTLLCEEMKKSDPLSLAIQSRLGGTALSSLGSLYDGGKRKIAALAPVAFTLAREGDTVALEILKQNMTAIARLIESTDTGAKMQRIVLTGGLSADADLLFPMISAELRNPEKFTLSVSEKRPIYGALLLAKRLKGGNPC